MLECMSLVNSVKMLEVRCIKRECIKLEFELIKTQRLKKEETCCVMQDKPLFPVKS